MSEYIQCKDDNDLEAQMDKLKAGFISPDCRIYKQITFSDDACFYTVDAKTFYALYDLQSQIKMLSDGTLETSFTDLVSHAKELEKTFKNVLKLVEAKPIIKGDRNAKTV